MNLWQDISAQAMKELINGDNERAYSLWSKAVELIHEGDAFSCVEAGEVFYYLGKCQVDRNEHEEALKNLTQAEQIIVSQDPSHSMLKQLKYDLGQTLNKVGREEEATSRLRFAKDILVEPIPDYLLGDNTEDLDLKGIVKLMQKEGLLKDLTAKKLKLICKTITDETGVDADDINIAEVLDQYYGMTPENLLSDKCVCWRDFRFDSDFAELTNYINTIVGQSLIAADDVLVMEVDDTQKTSDTDNVRAYIKIAEKSGECLALPLGNLNTCTVQDFTRACNSIFFRMNDPRRFVNLAYFSGHEFAYFLDPKSAITLYKNGASGIFDNLIKDLEPDQGNEVRLVV